MSHHPAIPDYTDFQEIARGGMGVVYKAMQVQPNRWVAIKQLPVEAHTPANLHRFRNETQIAASLEHPRIVPIYDFGQVGNSPYLVSRYMAGGSLADYLAAHQTAPLPMVLNWAVDIADALQFIHEHNIVHQDMKPSNILLDSVGNAYLSDFGITGEISTEKSASADQIPPGSAPYMSPEQAQGQRLLPQTDVYSFAVTLFELLTGKHPFHAETPVGMIMRHIHDPIPNLCEVNPTLPASVGELLQWGMAKLPADRPATPTIFVDLLKLAIRQPNTSIRPIPATLEPEPQPVTTTGRQPKRQLQPLFLLGIAGIIALIFGVATTQKPTKVLPTILPPTTPVQTFTLPASTATMPPENSLANFATLTDKDGYVQFQDGALTIVANEPNIEWYSPAGMLNESNVHITTTVSTVDTPSNSTGEFGLICRWQNHNDFTAFAINPATASYAIWQRQGESNMPLQVWNSSDLLANLSFPMELEVICLDDQLALWVNGALVGSVIDPQPQAGDMALIAGMFSGEQFHVTFTDFAHTIPEIK